MHIPIEFMKFTDFFHQDFDLFFSDGTGLIEDAISNTPAQDLIAIKTFLDELLTSGKYNEAQLRAIWRSTNAEISPFRGPDGSCTEFLNELRSSLK
jgi:hypothetical protein